MTLSLRWIIWAFNRLSQGWAKLLLAGVVDRIDGIDDTVGDSPLFVIPQNSANSNLSMNATWSIGKGS